MFWHWLGDNWEIVTAVCLILGFIATKVWPLLRKAVHLLDDFAGEPDRDGVPGRPGVMKRLEQLEGLSRELKPNGGGSLKDAVNRVDARTEQLEQRLNAIERVVVPDQPRRWRR